jgi:hypothetical protein
MAEPVEGPPTLLGGRNAQASIHEGAVPGNGERDALIRRKAVADSKVNLKSDVPAKEAFINELVKNRGFSEARVTKSPADITARKGNKTYYFEIKWTSKEDKYFGAATITEWEAAFDNDPFYRFVVAMKRGDNWDFHEYTPSEFMTFSTIPPFKVYFSVPVSGEKAESQNRDTKSVKLTKDRLKEMMRLYNKFRPNE